MKRFSIIDWLHVNKSKIFENEEAAFRYLSEYGARDGVFSELCVDGVYDPQYGYDEQLMLKLGKNYAKIHGVLLLSLPNQSIVVATSDPYDIDVIDNIRTKFGEDLSIFLAKFSDIEKIFSSPTAGANDLHSSLSKLPESGSIERLFDQIVLEAIEMRASDVHFEHNFSCMRIRNRIDGRLFISRQLDDSITRAMIATIKLRARLRLDETRLPQDGRIQPVFKNKKYDIRVSIIPTIRGENAVLRIFNGTCTEFSLENIGLTPLQRKCLESLSNLENGLIMISGPTGSGKTTTLYSLLKNISSLDKKIVTVEDPVEYQLEHINQVAINEAIGLTFGNVIRALLRQAPNVIFIGEIRDAETAQATIQAALTGHLVLSSVHSGSAEEAIVRLRDLGVSDYLIDSCVRAVVAQQLARLKCHHVNCSTTPGVCLNCFGRGYFGRTGVFEILLNNALSNKLSPSKWENFGHLCTMEDSVKALDEKGMLFEEDKWLFK